MATRHAGSGRRRFLAAGVAAAALPGVARAAAGDGGDWVHAFAAYGQPRHGPDFKHFDYVNPDAPKGGTLFLRNPDLRTSFDKFNYFTLKGNAPAGEMHFMFEMLAVRGGDEPMTMYGVLAEAIQVAPDRMAISFRLHPKARFSNGEPVLALDVKYAFDRQSGTEVEPQWANNLAAVDKATILDERTIRFDLKEPSLDAMFKLGTLMPVFSRRWGAGRRFDEVVTDYPITSGPYTIGAADSGRRIEFVRNPDYWGRDLPSRRGFFNWDRVVYRYYQDEDVAIEAMKAGEFDILRAFNARIFVRRHAGPKWDSGRIVKEVMAMDIGQGLQSYHFNLRRPLFQDLRVRRALLLTYDFETQNRYRMFKRANSVFSNSEFAAEGLPSAGELALLEPFRAELPPEVFGPAFVAPRTDTHPNALRENLLAARKLFADAGWALGEGGVLRNAKGEPFEFEFLATDQSTVREEIWQTLLVKVGVRMKLRKVDYALYLRRLQEFDFDMAAIVEGANFTLPASADYVRLYASKTADEKGSENTRGVKSRAVDRCLDAMSRAATLEQLRDASRALDRVVMWNCWQIPEIYQAAIPVSYWNKFGLPAMRPRYFTIAYTLDSDPVTAWPELTWWIKKA